MKVYRTFLYRTDGLLRDGKIVTIKDKETGITKPVEVFVAKTMKGNITGKVEDIVNGVTIGIVEEINGKPFSTKWCGDMDKYGFSFFVKDESLKKENEITTEQFRDIDMNTVMSSYHYFKSIGVIDRSNPRSLKR